MLIGIIIGLVVGGTVVYLVTRKRTPASVTPPPVEPPPVTPEDPRPDRGAVERQR